MIKFGKTNFFMPLSIQTVSELVTELNNCQNGDYKKIASRIAVPLAEFEPYQFWKSETYTRNCIHKTKDYELILLCWDENQDTAIHCHNEQECWVSILKGDFKEVRYKEQGDCLVPDEKLELMNEGLSYMNDSMGYHRLSNVSDHKAMSLHLYVNPITSCKIYNEETEEFEMNDLQYYSYKGELVEEDVLY